MGETLDVGQTVSAAEEVWSGDDPSILDKISAVEAESERCHGDKTAIPNAVAREAFDKTVEKRIHHLEQGKDYRPRRHQAVVSWEIPDSAYGRRYRPLHSSANTR